MTPIPSTLHRSAVAISAAAVLGIAAAPAVAGGAAGGRSSAPAAEATPAKRAVATKRSSAAARTTKTRSAATKRRAKASAPRNQRARALTQVSVADALKRVSPFTGQTGAVVYSRTVTVDLRTGIAGRTPGQQAHSERWHEIGGGHRGHYISRTVDAASGVQLGRIEGWTSPQLSVVKSGSSPAVVGISCTPNVVPDPDVQLRADRAALASLPEGPVIDGVATRVGTHVAGASEVRNYLDAATGRPIRSTQNGPGSAEPEFQTTYLAWEERPAGGPSTDLVTTIPADAKLPAAAGPSGCLR